MNIPGILKRAALLAAALLAGGCYHMVPVALENAPIGADVRATISQDGLDRLQAEAGTGHPLLTSLVLNGRLEGRSPEELLLLVPYESFEGQYRARRVSQQFLLQRAEVASLSIRSLDRRRATILTVVLAFAGGALLKRALSGETGADDGIPRGPAPPEFRPAVR